VSTTRRELAAGAAAGALFLARAGQTAAAASDVEQLERLLTLEGRLVDAYRMALERDAIERALGEGLLAQERAHVRALEQALRWAGRRAPRATVPPPASGTAFADRRAFARFALELERRTVATYLDALATYRNRRLLQAIGSIMGADVQHEVALRQVLGTDLLGVG
jgi:Ferritin-like domain